MGSLKSPAITTCPTIMAKYTQKPRRMADRMRGLLFVLLNVDRSSSPMVEERQHARQTLVHVKERMNLIALIKLKFALISFSAASLLRIYPEMTIASQPIISPITLIPYPNSVTFLPRKSEKLVFIVFPPYK